MPHARSLTRRLHAALGLPAFLGGAYLTTCWFIVRSMIRIPRKRATRTPAEFGLPEAGPVSVLTEDGVRLAGWLVPGARPCVIVIVHGLNSHAWDGGNPEVARAYRDAGFHVFLYDSRGQGRSGGSLGLAWRERHDLRAVVNLLLDRGFQPGCIGVHATSYGAATALAALPGIPEVGALIADSSYADVRDIMEDEVVRHTGVPGSLVWLLGPGLRLVTRTRYGVDLDEIPPERGIRAIGPRPLLLIHGEKDPVIPVGDARRLHRAAPPGTELWILHGLAHTEGTRLAPDYEDPSPARDLFLATVTDFFERSLGRGDFERTPT